MILKGADYNNRHGNIRNTETFLNNIWEWDFLNDCFSGTRIRVSDLDGAVERNSHLLIIETKQPNVPLNKGQEIMFKSLQKTGLVTIFVVWGERNKPEAMRCFYPMLDKVIDYPKITEDDLKGWVKRWFNYANKTDWHDAVLRQAL